MPFKRAPNCANAPKTYNGDNRTRTCDPLHVKQMLSQLSYISETYSTISPAFWQAEFLKIEKIFSVPASIHDRSFRRRQKSISLKPTTCGILKQEASQPKKGVFMMDFCKCQPETGPLIIAMASVPFQPWEPPYDPEKALRQGTIFPCPDLQFYLTGGDAVGR